MIEYRPEGVFVVFHETSGDFEMGLELWALLSKQAGTIAGLRVLFFENALKIVRHKAVAV